MSSDPTDLTARARIRDAALEVFAEQGEGATIRGIAERAGTSPALVQHHYRTKSGLRDACDAYVVEYLREGVALGIDRGEIADPAYTAEIYRTGPRVVRYLARALVDQTPGAAQLFDRIVDLTTPYLRGAPDVDPRHRAAVLVAMRLGLIVLHPHVSRALGTDMLGTDGAVTVGRAMLDLLNPDLTDPGVLDNARTGIDRLERTTTQNSKKPMQNTMQNTVQNTVQDTAKEQR